MLKLRVLEILKEKGKTKYWLFNQFNMSYQNFSNMINNKTKSIKYENLELLCEILGCDLDELFVLTKDERK